MKKNFTMDFIRNENKKFAKKLNSLPEMFQKKDKNQINNKFFVFSEQHLKEELRKIGFTRCIIKADNKNATFKIILPKKFFRIKENQKMQLLIDTLYRILPMYIYSGDPVIECKTFNWKKFKWDKWWFLGGVNYKDFSTRERLPYIERKKHYHHD